MIRDQARPLRHLKASLTRSNKQIGMKKAFLAVKLVMSRQADFTSYLIQQISNNNTTAHEHTEFVTLFHNGYLPCPFQITLFSTA